MKKLIFKTLFLACVIFAPASAMAEVSIHVDIPLPPPIFFPAPPPVVVIPETEVYAVPDIQEEIFFYGGWWWRPWQGRWYRSRYYDRGWAYYHYPPYFYKRIPPGWRDDYRNHHWRGYRWEHKPIPHHEFQHNWQGWKRDRYWENKRWGVQGWKDKGPAPKYKYRKPGPGPQPGHGPGPKPGHSPRPGHGPR